MLIVVTLVLIFGALLGANLVIWWSAWRAAAAPAAYQPNSPEAIELRRAKPRVLRRYYFECDRIQHTRTQFWTALHVFLLALTAAAVDRSTTLALLGAFLGLSLWPVWLLSCASMHRRLRWLDGLLLGQMGQQLACPVHKHWLRHGLPIASSTLLVWALPLIVLAAWGVLAVYAAVHAAQP